MTHEELVERVAEALSGGRAFEGNAKPMAEWYREIAREAIRITGEACAAEITALTVLKQYGTAPVALSEGFAMPRLAFKSAILSLTQGTKS